MIDRVITHTPRSTRRKELTLLCGLTLVLLLPFINKPFHIDDPLYIWTAQQIRNSPLDFYGFHLNWQGHDQPVSQFFQNPPLTSYLLAAVSLIAGYNHVAFHFAFLPFDLLSIVGMYLLAERFCLRPFLAALLLLLCPAFVVSATTVMCEPLMICFWIWAIYFWVIGIDRKPSFLWLAGTVTLIALLTKFVAIAIVPLLILYALFHQTSKRIAVFQAIALAIPIAGAIAYESFTAHRYGTGAFANALNYVAGTRQLMTVPAGVKLLNTFCFLGGCAAASVFLLPLIFRWWMTLSLLLLIMLSLAIADAFPVPGGWQHTAMPVLEYYGQYFFWMTGGLGLAILAITRLNHLIRRGKWHDEIFIFSWIVGVFLFTAFINWSINARSMLPILPPVCLITVRSLDSYLVLPKFRTAAVMVLSALLAVTVTAADYNLASTIRSAALKLSQSTPAPFWFCGHWGFQYYIELGGGRAVDDLAPQLRWGDLLIVPRSQYGGKPDAKGLIHLRQIQVGPGRWATTADAPMGGDFYCSYGYGLPFVFGSIPPETFDIVQVTAQTHIRPPTGVP